MYLFAIASSVSKIIKKNPNNNMIFASMCIILTHRGRSLFLFVFWCGHGTSALVFFLIIPDG